MNKIKSISEFIQYSEQTEYMHVEIPQSYSFTTLSTILISIYLLYLKVNDSLLTSWFACFYPIFFLLLIKFIMTFLEIVKENNRKVVLGSFYGEEEEIVVKLDNLILLANLFNLIHYCFSAFCCYFFSEFLDSKNDDYIFYFINVIIGMIGNQMIFSLLSRAKWFDIKQNSKNSKLKDFESSENSNNGNDVEHNDSFVVFIASITTPILTYFSNMMLICSANSGVCTQFYLSTLTSLLGAFGINVSNLSVYLFPITIVMLIVSNISLYIKRKKFAHPPFLLGIFSTVLIIISKIYEDYLWMFNYIGSILILIAAIWNAKMNKFFGIPDRKKKFKD